VTRNTKASIPCVSRSAREITRAEKSPDPDAKFIAGSIGYSGYCRTSGPVMLA
jgi:hypothetical protein